MSILQAIVYGIVQGVTEFLPVSSTAHLVLIPWIFGWQDPGVAFDVAMHLGTALAVIIYFFKDWLRLISAGLTKPKSGDGKLFWLIVLATIPGGLFGILLNDFMDNFRNPVLIGVMLIVMGVILYLSDKTGKNTHRLCDMNAKRSITIGLSQVFAIVPGVSRSGITLSAGRLLGIDRESIARFTFLMSTPIILGNGLYHAKNLLHTNIDALPFITALLVSAVVGILCISFLLEYLKKKGLGVFAIYRFALGVLIIALNFIK